MKLIIRRHFDAAHYLPHYIGKCNTMHGHRWHVDLYFEGGQINTYSGMLMDFKKVKEFVDKLLPDHRCLNDTYDNPTAEILASTLFAKIKFESKKRFDDYDFKFVKLVLWESPECGIEVEDD